MAKLVQDPTIPPGNATVIQRGDVEFVLHHPIHEITILAGENVTLKTIDGFVTIHGMTYRPSCEMFENAVFSTSASFMTAYLDHLPKCKICTENITENIP